MYLLQHCPDYQIDHPLTDLFYICPHPIVFAGFLWRYQIFITNQGILEDYQVVTAATTSLLDLLPPPSPLVPYPSPLSEQGIHSPAFHPLFLREPSSFLPRPAFVHPLSSHWCLDNINPLVTGFMTPPHLTLHPQPPPQGAVPRPTSPSLCAPPLPLSSPGQHRHLAGETPSTP